MNYQHRVVRGLERVMGRFQYPIANIQFPIFNGLYGATSAFVCAYLSIGNCELLIEIASQAKRSRDRRSRRVRVTLSLRPVVAFPLPKWERV